MAKFMQSDASNLLSSFKRDLFLMYSSAVLCRIYDLDLPTSSTITGMLGAKADVSAAAAADLYCCRSSCVGWANLLLVH